MEAVSQASASRTRIASPTRASGISDELLARRAASGSKRAFEAIYARHHQALYAYCRSILRTDADSEDVLQETFAKALSALRRDQRSAPLRPWLFKIAHNEAISLIRRRQRDSAEELDEQQLPGDRSAAETASQRARWGQLMADLTELPERLRSALLLRELSGLSHEEIALALDTTPGAAKQSILDARRALREYAEGRAMDCDQVCRRLSAGDRRALRARRVRAHLRDCGACRAFAAAIDQRRSDLRAFVPVLSPVASAALLAKIVHGGSGSAAGTLGSASTTLSASRAGMLGKAVGATGSLKTVTTAAVVVVAAGAGTAGLTHALHSSTPPASSRPTAVHTGASPGASAAGKAHGGTAQVGQRAVVSPGRHGAAKAGGVSVGLNDHHGPGAAHGKGAAFGNGGPHGKGAAAAHEHGAATGAQATHGAGAATHGRGTGVARAGRSHAIGAHRAGGTHRARHAPARGRAPAAHRGAGLGKTRSSHPTPKPSEQPSTGSGTTKHAAAAPTSVSSQAQNGSSR